MQNSTFWVTRLGGDNDWLRRLLFFIRKTITTTVPLKCEFCGKEIPKGTMALKEKGYNRLEGDYIYYYHLDEYENNIRKIIE